MTAPHRGERPPGPDEPGGDWVDRLLDDIAQLPLIPEDRLDLAVRVGNRSELTAAEKRTLQAAASGLDAQMTADAYGLSRSTIEAQLSAARFVLRAKNTTHAVTLAFRQGLVH